MPKKIIISFDGTWNTPGKSKEVDGDGSTNVWKLHEAIADIDADGVRQVKWYEEGVGTKWYNKVRGGAFGVGLSDKIKEGYVYLAKNFEVGDQVFIFGFSRGAYSARSLIGLVRNAGLLKKENIKKVHEAYSLYRARDEGADSESAKYFRGNYSILIDIHFLGVWDTVGALGVPIESFKWFNKKYYQFHDTELSGIVKNAFHAVAIDEHRKNYQCTLWEPKEKPNQKVEQAWFSGAHANVGGGYADSNLSDIALLWMKEKAKEQGLEFDDSKIPKPPEDTPAIIDSYIGFMGGSYSMMEPRHFRKIGFTSYGQESVDVTVIRRAGLDSSYRPKNVIGANLIGDIRPTDRIRG